MYIRRSQSDEELERKRTVGGNWERGWKKKCINYLQLFDLQLPTFPLRWTPPKSLIVI